MDNLEKYLDQVIEQRPVHYESPSEPEQEVKTNFLRGVGRRWYIVLLVVIVVCGLGLPAVWLLIQPRYVVQGAVRVAPLVRGILTGADSGEISNYRDFVNTQATILLSSQVIENIADDLRGRNLSFFNGEARDVVGRLKALIRPSRAPLDVAAVLKKAVADREVRAGHISQSELIAVSMTATDIDEAKQIVDSFLRNYQVMYGSVSDQKELENLKLLEDQQVVLAGKIEMQRARIRELADEYGSTVLDNRQDMEMRRQTALLSELTRLEAQRLSIEASIGLLQESGDPNVTPEQLVAAHKAYVDSDPMVAELAKTIVDMTRDLILAKETFAPGNPSLAQREKLLEAFKKTLEEKRKELEQEYDDGLTGRMAVAVKQRLDNVQGRLEQIKAHEKRLREVLNLQDTTTRKVGRTNLDIQDLQFRVGLDQELYDQISRRIKRFDMERPGRARITLAYPADVVSTEDKRVKYTVALIFGGLGCGFGLAFMRDKMDTTLQTPEDVARHLDLPIIGTTTSSRTVKPAMFAEQIAGDYQTIRTNLGLLSSEGMPGKLAITSPGMREGKTTFAVNLATSLAKSGKKVLLIDGDLRKPDIGYMLNMPNGSGLQEVLLGEDPSGIIHTVPSSGLHVLAANPRNLADAYELLTSSTAAEQIMRLSHEYDHIIVDTPPALVFPDTLVWAKLADAVILVSYAGQTTAPEMKEAKERFARIRARVVGAVLSNVPADQSLYRYGYSSRGRSAPSVRQGKKTKKLLLATSGREDEASTKKT